MSGDLEKQLRCDGVHVPEEAREEKLWVVWDVDEKTALAPWDTGHMYRAKWSKNSGKNPRAKFKKAQAAADLPIRQIHKTWPFPDEDDLPEQVKPTILLPEKDYYDDTPITFVDYDDVVSDDNTIPKEVWETVKYLGGPTFFSSSGDGLHQWVRGELPSGLGKYIADFDEIGHIEMYDHSRMTGSTWRHVEGTPADELPEAQSAIDDIVEKYATEDHLRRMAEGEIESPHPADTNRTGGSGNARTKKHSGDRSAYYEIDVQDIAETDTYFNRYASNTRGNQLEGPHPQHGPQSGSGHETCTNFGVETSENVWKCWLHDDGGGGLELIAIMETRGVSCGNSGRIHDTPTKLLETCLYARDKYSHRLEDEKPPYKALVGVAEVVGLSFKNEIKRELGKDSYEMARKLYDDLEAGDI